MYEKAKDMPVSLIEFCDKYNLDIRNDDELDAAFLREEEVQYMSMVKSKYDDITKHYLIQNPMCWQRRWTRMESGACKVKRPKPVLVKTEKTKKDYKDDKFNF